MGYHSKHTFMFPFQWDYIDKKRDFYNNRTNLADFQRLFEAIDNGFQLTPFKIGYDVDKYNEFSYFHPFARKALYYTEDNRLLRYYEIEHPNGEYHIEYLKEGNNTKAYENQLLALTLDNICVHVYATGVGVVTFNITNYKYPNKEAILAINEFGRRMYPQFMSKENRLAAKEAFLPNRLWGRIADFEFDEDFSAYQSGIQTDSIFLPPDHIKKVFGYKGKEQIGDHGQKFVFRKREEQKGTIRISPVTDDRMFFLSHYNKADLVDQLAKRTDPEKEPIAYAFELDNFWYAYIFGDKEGPSIADDRMQRNDILKATYTRWLDTEKRGWGSGSLYGISRDSFVSIGTDFIGQHMQTMYYQMAILCLVQRASILRFSWEISQIINRLFANKKVKPEQAIRELYENYIRFINQIYFREITPQIQGIELYNLFQKEMNLEKEAKDLDGEMQELFNYLSVKEQTHLGQMANLFLPLTLLIGFFSMHSINDHFFNRNLSSIGINANLTLYDLVTTILAIWTIIVFMLFIFRNKFKH